MKQTSSNNHWLWATTIKKIVWGKIKPKIKLAQTHYSEIQTS